MKRTSPLMPGGSVMHYRLRMLKKGPVTQCIDAIRNYRGATLLNSPVREATKTGTRSQPGMTRTTVAKREGSTSNAFRSPSPHYA